MTILECALAFLLIGNGFAFFFSHARRIQDVARIQDVERKLDLVLAHFGIDPTAQVAPSSHVMSLAADPRQRIEAIKAYRMQTGAVVKEAKAVIDKIAASAKGAGA
jgi:ribosomal protein L7/L12